MTKYAPLWLMLLAVAGLGWAGVAAVRAPAGGMARMAPAAMVVPSQANAAALLRVQAQERALALIAGVRARAALALVAQVAPISAAGEAAPARRTAAGAGTVSAAGLPAAGSVDGPKAAPAAPAISLVYLSPDMQRVVIDGKLLAVGDALPGGARVVAISAERIVTQRRGQRQVTLKVPEGQLLGTVAADKKAGVVR